MPERTASIALVHHANQYVVTTGYDDREGIDELVAGYAAVLRLHEERQVPADLHVSGTLLEAAAWHTPWFLELVGRLHASGLVELVGGTYADGVMTVLPASLNRRGIVEHLGLYRHHLGCEPEGVSAFWVPERVWETSTLAPILASPELPNGGFRSVLLDDRLFYPPSGDGATSPRGVFDAAGPYDHPAHDLPRTVGDVPSPAVVAAGEGLVAVPISSWLRYCVPPRRREHWDQLRRVLGCAAEAGDDVLLVYADDLERTAGLAPWERHAFRAYAAFLDWLTADRRLVPVLLSSWVDVHPPQDIRATEAGTFFELAHARQAGEDYRGWWDAPAWAPYRRHLTEAEGAIRSAERDGIGGTLVDLAWKHLLASTYETAWHEGEPEVAAPAPWARATASHARACLTIVAAARSLVSPAQPRAEVADIDGDGEEEAVVSNGAVYAVLAPRRGGRLTALFARTPAGDVQVIGNPTDDWNWQEELHRYMERPPNHPGALTDVGFEHDRYEVAAASTSPAGASLELTDVDPMSPLNGTRKRVLLPADRPELVVCYCWPTGIAGLAVDLCLSPHYLRLLREGRACLAVEGEDRRRGARAGDVAVWVNLAPGEATAWLEHGHREVGHGVNLRLRSETSHFHLVIACGADADSRPWCLEDVLEIATTSPTSREG